MTTSPPRATLMVPRTQAEVGPALRHGRALAGGTDVLVQRRAGVGVTALVDLTNLSDAPPPVEVVQVDGSPRLRLSAVAPLAVLVGELGDRFPALADAVAVFAAQQIRNRATLGGNLVTGSPAGDTVPALLVADGVVDIRSDNPAGAHGMRHVALADFLLGPRQVDLAPGEWVQTVTVRPSPPVGGFRKVGGRRALAISFVNLAWQWTRGADGALSGVRLSMGAVAPTVVRLPSAERVLEGHRCTPDAVDRACAAVQDDISPIDDLRASARYRRQCAAGLLREALLPELSDQREKKP